MINEVERRLGTRKMFVGLEKMPAFLEEIELYFIQNADLIALLQVIYNTKYDVFIYKVKRISIRFTAIVL